VAICLNEARQGSFQVAAVRTNYVPYGTNAECAPWNSRVRFAAASATELERPFLLGGRYRVLAELGHSPFKTVGF
jgi:hypothetical protein